MKSRVEKFEKLGMALELASKLSHELGLDHLPILLNMARLELLNELSADGGNQHVGEPRRGISSSRRDIN
jgi:hypothetical protein